MSVVKATLVTATMRMGGIGLQFLWFVLLVRLLPVEQVGVYSLMNGVWILFRALGALGGDQGMIRHGPVLLDAGEQVHITGLVRHAVLRSTLWLVPPGMLVAAVMFATLDASVMPWMQGQWLWCLAFGAGAYAMVICSILSASILVYERQVSAYAPESLILPALLIVSSLIMHHYEMLSLPRLVMIQSAAIMLTAAVYLYLFIRLNGWCAEHIPTTERQEFNQLSWRLVATIALNNLNLRIPLLLSPFLVGTAGTAMLELAMRFASMMGVIQWCASYVIMPKLSRLKEHGARDTLQLLLVQGCWIVFVPATVMYGGYILLGDWIITLVAGNEVYDRAYLALLIIAFGFWCNASSGATTHFYTMLGHERTAYRISSAECVLMLLSLAVLSHYYGLYGVAASVSVGLVVRNGLLNMLLYRTTGFYSGLWSAKGWRHTWRMLTA